MLRKPSKPRTRADSKPQDLLGYQIITYGRGRLSRKEKFCISKTKLIDRLETPHCSDVNDTAACSTGRKTDGDSLLCRNGRWRE